MSVSRGPVEAASRDPRAGKVVVVGAGLVGCLAAIFLARRGYRVEVFERHGDLREGDFNSRRSSINLSLCNRGIEVLDRIGLGAAARRLSVPAYGRLIHDPQGGLTYQPYGTRGEATFSILRNDLNRLLLDAAEKRFGVRLHFQERCRDLDLETATLQLEDTRSGRLHHEPADRVLGADGAFSAVRARLQRTPGFNYSQEYLDHGYKELNIPAGEPIQWMERREVVHLWPRGGYMLLGLPNVDGSFVCALHLPLEGDPSFASLATAEDLRRLLATSFPDVARHRPTAADTFLVTSLNHLVCVRCFPWSLGGRVALLGDAAHAVVPFYAQGVNCGFEDCEALDRALDRHGDDWRAALPAFERERKPNTDAIAELSLQHFHELRDRVGDPLFQLRKRIERKLAERHPERFTPLYWTVTFTSTPYAEAMVRGKQGEAIVDRIMRAPDLERRTESELLGLIDEAIVAA